MSFMWMRFCSRGLGFIVPAEFTVWFWHRTKFRKSDDRLSPRAYASAKKTYANAFPWSPAQPGLYVNPITKQLMQKWIKQTDVFLHKDESISFMWMRFCSRESIDVELWNPGACECKKSLCECLPLVASPARIICKSHYKATNGKMN